MTFEADANSYEAAAERKAEQKLLFHPCRRWYADKRNVRLQAAHGLFPAMWMELEAWAGWKSVRKEYLKFLKDSRQDNRNLWDISSLKGDDDRM